MKRTVEIVILAALLAACTVFIPAGGGQAPQVTAPTFPAPGANPAPTSAIIPAPPWGAMGLQGSLVLIRYNGEAFAIQRLDLPTGQQTTLFQAPEEALLNAALASPDGKQLLLAYAPPSTQQNPVSYTSLYLMPADGSAQPKPIIGKPADTDAFFAPAWAPDGTIYTSHFVKAAGNNAGSGAYEIDRVAPDGKLSLVLKDAMWPMPSPDGKMLAYVTAAPDNTGRNDLYIAGVDGSNPKPAIPPGSFPAVDDHFYTPDGQAIIFSAVNPQPTPTPTAFDRLLGIRVASAHNTPSDWYRVSLVDSSLTRLTQLADTRMYASPSPDGKQIAFIASSGLYVMAIDGSGLMKLEAPPATGTVSWIR